MNANTTSLPKKESGSFPVCCLSTASHVKPIRSWVETNYLFFFFFFTLQYCIGFHKFLLNTIGLYRPWNSPGQNTGMGSCSLLQGIFPTQGSNPGLPHCRWILYQLRRATGEAPSTILNMIIMEYEFCNTGLLMRRTEFYFRGWQNSPLPSFPSLRLLPHLLPPLVDTPSGSLSAYSRLCGLLSRIAI